MIANPELTRVMEVLQRELPSLRERYHIASLALFGSVVRSEHRPDSDIDVLVTFDKVPTLFEYVEIQDALTELLGRKVDLVHKEALRPAIGKRILAEMVPV